MSTPAGRAAGYQRFTARALPPPSREMTPEEREAYRHLDVLRAQRLDLEQQEAALREKIRRVETELKRWEGVVYSGRSGYSFQPPTADVMRRYRRFR